MAVGDGEDGVTLRTKTMATSDTKPESAAIGRSRWRQSIAVDLPSGVRWVSIVNFIVSIARLTIPFLGLYFTVQMNYSQERAAVFVAVYGIGAVSSSLSAGILSDRLGRKPILLMGTLGSVAVCTTLIWARAPAEILVLLVLLGWCVNAPQIAINALITDMTDVSTRREAFAVNTWGHNVGFAIGPAAVGAWLGSDYAIMFVCQAAITAIVALIVMRKVRETFPSRRYSDEQTRTPSLPRDALLYRFVALNFVFTLMFAQFSFGLPLAVEKIGYHQDFYALLMGVNGVFLALLQLPIQRAARRYKPHQILTLGALIMAAADGITASSSTRLSYIAMMLAFTFAEALYMPTSDYIAAYMSSDRERGRYHGVHKTVFFVAQLCAPLLAGVLLTRASVAFLWLTCVGLGVGAAAGLWSLGRAFEDRSPRHVAEMVEV